MPRLAVLVASLLLTGPLLAAATAPAAAGATVVLDGVRGSVPTGGTQVVTVRHTHSWHARVSLWERTPTGWRAATRTVDGRTGYGGLGTHLRAGTWDLPYRTIRRGDFWVDDNATAYYNRCRNRSQSGFRWWLTSGPEESERPTDFPVQYEYAVNTAFNLSQVRHRGAGMQSAMARLDPARQPVIAIGR